MNQKDDRPSIIPLLKSGDFTILYHDNNFCCLHTGRTESYEQFELKEEVRSFQYGIDGYTPDIVAALVEALGGKVFSV